MANNRKDVNLVLRAKDEATKNIKGVKQSLQDLSEVQNDLARTAAKADGVLGGLASEMGNLNKQAQGLESLGKISGQLNAAAGAVDKFEAAIRRAKGNTQALVDSFGQIGARAQGLKTQLAASNTALEGQRAASEKAKTDLQALNVAVSTAQKEFKALEAQFKKTSEPSKQLGAQYTAQKIALDGLLQSQTAAKANVTAQAKALKDAAAANKELNFSYDAAKRAQASMRGSIVESTKALAQQRTEAGQTKASLLQTVSAATQAAKGFGAVALSENEISAASKRAAVDIKNVSAALDAQNKISSRKTSASADLKVPGVIAAYNEFKVLEDEVKRIAQVMKAAVAPTDELNRQFLLAVSAARAGKDAYDQQRASLTKTASVAGSFKGFDKIATDLQRTASAAGSLGGATKGAVQPLAALNAQTKATASAMTTAATQTNRLGTEFKKTGDNSRTALSFIQRIRAEVLSLATGYIGLYASLRQIGGVVKSFQTLEAAQNRLGSVFGQDQAKVAREISFLNGEADRLGISFAILADQYSKISVSASEANFSVADTRKLFISVAEAARVNKLSTEQMNGVFLAFTQMINKGKINSEELSRQLGDRLPGAVNLFATALGYSTSELLNMMKAGEVFADKETLLKVADKLTDRYGAQLPEALRSLTTQLGRFDNSLYQSQLAVAKGGFATALTQALAKLNKQLSTNEAKQFFNDLGSAIGSALTVLAKIPENFDAIVKVLKVIAAIKVSSVLSNLFGAFATASGTAAASMQRLAFTAATTGSALSKMVSRPMISMIGALDTKIGTLKASLQGVTSVNLAARTAVNIAGLSALRGVAIGTATAFRTLWAAMGGLPGLVISGLVYIGSLLLGMESDIEKVNSAIDKSDKLIETLKTQFKEATNLSGQMAKQLSKVSQVELDIAFRKMEDSLNSLRDNLAVPFKAPGVENLQEDFRLGRISAVELRAGIDAIAKANPNLRDGYLQDLYDTADAAQRLEGKMDENRAGFRQLGGVATEADQKLLRLNEGVNDLNETFGSATSGTDKFKDGLDELRELIPDLANEMERLNKLSKIDDIVKEMGEPRDIEQLIEQTKLLQQAREAANKEAAVKSVSGSFAQRVAGVESSGNAEAKNPNSSATGLGQFIRSTWISLFRESFPDRAKSMSDEAIAELRKNAELSSKMIDLYAEKNAAVLQKAGVAVNDTALYMSHFLGPDGAIKVLQAAADTPVKALLSQKAIDANPTVLKDKTAGQVRDFAASKIGDPSERQVAIAEELQKIDTTKQENADKFLKTLEQETATRQLNIDLASKTEREQAVGKALQDAKNSAIEAGVVLTQKQIDLISTMVGKEYDAVNATKLATEAREKVEKKVNDLLEYREQLQQQVVYAESQGNNQLVGDTNTALLAVNAELEKAIDNSIAMWTALGGEEADLAIAKLNTQKMSLQDTQNEYLMTGKAINEAFASQSSNAIINMTDKIVEGGDALETLRDGFLTFASDFLKMIAQMILQQAIFNAISGGAPGGAGGLGGGISGLIGKVFQFHQGGVVGAGGNVSRAANPAWFANAPRYHDGGIAGLKPGEVPAILQKGEEVLTGADPRNIINQAGAGGGGTKIINAFDGASFLSESLNSKVGEKALLNFVSSNSKQFKKALG